MTGFPAAVGGRVLFSRVANQPHLIAGGVSGPKPLLLPVSVAPVTGATAHTWGSWVTVTASTTADSQWLHIVGLGTNSGNTTNTSSLVQVGVGEADSEVPLATFACGYRNGAPGSSVALIANCPCPIPAGSRIAVRVQSVRTSQTITLGVGTSTFNGKVSAPIAWGVDTATSRGITVTAPTGSNATGAWTELASSTAADVMAVHFGPQMAGSTATAVQTVDIEIGTGASSSETPVAAARFTHGISESLTPHTPLLVPALIPAGTRLVARVTRSDTGANAPTDLIVHGVPV